jgi:hypothetical protein
MDRTEHMNWVKQRALDELAASGPIQALASFQSDLSKRPETKDHSGLMLSMMLASQGHLQTPHQVREFIEGLN